MGEGFDEENNNKREMSKRPKVDREILSILNDYHLFIDSDKKIDMPFCVDEIDKNHPTSLKGSSDLTAEHPLGHTVMECEMRERSEFNYTFRILSDAIKKRMLFRMDEGDGTHWNRHLLIPVDQQQVSTPHFHKVGDDGIDLAYKSMSLDMYPVPLNIRDGFKAFCEEIHIKYDCIQIQIQENNALPLEFPPEVDPLIDIQFP